MTLLTVVGVFLYAMRFEIASQGFGVLLSDFAASIVDNTGYPVQIESQPLQLTTTGKRAVLITESSLDIYNTAGNCVIQQRMAGKNAIAVSAGRYLLTYLRGGYELWLRSGETILFYQKFDRPIYAAALAPNGAIAVSTTAVGDQAQVTVYDSSFQECFVWMSSGRIIHSLALSDEGTRLAVGGVEFSGGVLSSCFSLFDITNETAKARCEVSLSDELLLAMVLRENGSAIVVTDRGVHGIAANGSRRGTYSYEEKPLAAFSLDEEHGVLLAVGNYDSTHSLDLVRLDAEVRQTASGTCDREILSLHFYGDEALAYTGERVLRYDSSLKRAGSTETPDAVLCTIVGNQLYYATLDRLDRVAIR